MPAEPVATYAFLDLESTGLPGIGDRPRITELSLVAVHRNSLLEWQTLTCSLPRVVDKLTVCVYPMKAVSPGAAFITGLYNDNLYHQKDFDPHLADMLMLFLQRLDPPVCLVAHNGNKFDFGLLMTEIQRYNKMLPNSVLCADSLEAFKALDEPEEHIISCEVCKGNEDISKKSPSKVNCDLNEMQLINEITPEMQVIKSGVSFSKSVGGDKRKSSDKTREHDELPVQAHKAKRKLFPDDLITPLASVCTKTVNMGKDLTTPSGKSPLEFKKQSTVILAQESNHGNQRRASSSSSGASLALSLSSQGSSMLIRDNLLDHVQPDGARTPSDVGSEGEFSPNKTDETETTVEYWSDLWDEFSVDLSEHSAGMSNYPELKGNQNMQHLCVKETDVSSGQNKTPASTSPDKGEAIWASYAGEDELSDADLLRAVENSPQHLVSGNTIPKKASQWEGNKLPMNIKAHSSRNTNTKDMHLLHLNPNVTSTEKKHNGCSDSEKNLTSNSIAGPSGFHAEKAVSSQLGVQIPNQSKRAKSPSSTTKKPKISYSLAEIHKRVVGHLPDQSHRAEDDCLALVRIFQRKAKQVCSWVDQHAVPFNSYHPLYRTKLAKPLPPGIFPYQL